MTPISGSGTGTPISIVPGGVQSVSPLIELSAVTLARYAEILGINECSLWGVATDTAIETCRTIWSLQQRKEIARYLMEAQAEVESVTGYPIGYQWIEEPKRKLKSPIVAQKGYVQSGGIKGVTLIQAGVVVNYVTDPAVIGPIATAVTDPNEIAIYHPGTEIPIVPISTIIAGGNVTITVPLCRLVAIAYEDNPTVGLQYSDYSTWGERTVDVYRIFNDTSMNATVHKNHSCSEVCSCGGCEDFTATACEYVRQPEIGSLELHLATYTDGAWVNDASTCSCYDWVTLRYLAGIPITLQAEDTIIRLAHSKMPQEPCGCDPARTVWTRDRNIPQAITMERANCPFGQSDGAWNAWQFAKSMRLMRGGILR